MKIKYSFDIFKVINGSIVSANKIKDYESEIITIAPNDLQNKKAIQLRREIILKYPDCVIGEITTPDDEESKKLLEEALKTKELRLEILSYDMNRILDGIKIIRDTAENFNLLDEQLYLNFLDKLNEYSIDQNRKSTNPE